MVSQNQALVVTIGQTLHFGYLNLDYCVPGLPSEFLVFLKFVLYKVIYLVEQYSDYSNSNEDCYFGMFGFVTKS